MLVFNSVFVCVCVLLLFHVSSFHAVLSIACVNPLFHNVMEISVYIISESNFGFMLTHLIFCVFYLPTLDLVNVFPCVLQNKFIYEIIICQ